MKIKPLLLYIFFAIVLEISAYSEEACLNPILQEANNQLEKSITTIEESQGAVSGPVTQVTLKGDSKTVVYATQKFLPYERPNGDILGVSQFRIGSENGEEAAKLSYKINKDRLYIMDMQTAAIAQKNDLQFIMQRDLLRAHPEITSIQAELVNDNLMAYQEAIRAGMSHEKALEQTPCYRIAKRLGLGKIDYQKSVLRKGTKRVGDMIVEDLYVDLVMLKD